MKAFVSLTVRKKDVTEVFTELRGLLWHVGVMRELARSQMGNVQIVTTLLLMGCRQKYVDIPPLNARNADGLHAMGLVNKS